MTVRLGILRTPTITLLALGVLRGVWTSPVEAQSPVDPKLYQALEWRSIGPFRGGRATVVEGVRSEPFTFYMGAAGGGVWRTTDGGESWENISDGWFKTGSVGTIAVAPSDRNVIYVGMGERCVRGVTTSHGDGVYKSTDGGKTWTHMGLAATRHTSDIQVHPDDPDIVYVAAQGSPWGSHQERGVYRSKDGGQTWELLLHNNERTGANNLVMDPNNPRILYATMWEHRRRPWHGYELSSGGPGSGLYKTSDGGDSWRQLAEGLPERVGKLGLSVSPANSDRVYALVESTPDASGLYRSDDAGESWELINDQHVLTERSAYYMHVVADPQDSDVVYVLNAPFLKSIDGGESFSRIATPHGDNHDLWIHPENSDWMVEANDGGVNVSYNGGKSWSTQGNQPTGQFYRVITDNLFPYHIYGGQQDNTTVKINSRTFSGGIGPKDWYAVGGGESAHVAFDPDNPVLIYAGNYQGQITEFDDRTGTRRNVMRYPLRTAFRPGGQYPYRFNWNAPILVSQHDRSVIYHGAQVVLKSTDRGNSWEEISPDLTRNEPEKQGVVEGELTTHGTAGEMYNTIFYIAESPHAAGELWVGTDDGRIHLTRDEGEHWEEITPPGLGETQINMIEVSPHRPGKAFIVATRYKFNDFTPNIYRTEDYGQSWERLTSGIPADDFVRVVREDTEREGLLFAGTETSMYVSFDDARSWQRMQLNLPRVPVTDLRVHENDLVAATQGRAFWILDDISPLRQLEGAVLRADAHLFAPAPTERVHAGRGAGSDMGQNPPTGTLIHYWLGDDVIDSEIRLDILGADGNVVNRFGPEADGEPETPLLAWAREAEPEPELSTDVGLNRFVWDWRVAEIDDYPELVAYRDSRSYRVAPGTYEARLMVNGQVLSQSLQVLPDPRSDVPAEEHAKKQALLADIYADAEAVQQAVESLKHVREQIENVIALSMNGGASEIADKGEELTAKIGDWLHAVIEERDRPVLDALHRPARLDFNLLAMLETVDAMKPPLTAGVQERVADLRAEWATRAEEYQVIIDEDLVAFNALTGTRSIPPVAPYRTTAGGQVSPD